MFMQRLHAIVFRSKFQPNAPPMSAMASARTLTHVRELFSQSVIKQNMTTVERKLRWVYQTSIKIEGPHPISHELSRFCYHNFCSPFRRDFNLKCFMSQAKQPMQALPQTMNMLTIAVPPVGLFLGFETLLLIILFWFEVENQPTHGLLVSYW